MPRRHDPRDAPAPRTARAPARPQPTLGELRSHTCWLRLICDGCGHEAPAALAPFLIRWGPQASSDVLRRRSRCARCGARGATLMHPSWIDSQVGFAPFPAARRVAVK